MSKRGSAGRALLAMVFSAGLAWSAQAQVTPAAGATPPDDTPKFNIGTTIFADYTYQDSPTSKDSDGNVIHPSSFNINRAYINVTGNLNHWISFRITPDVARETSSSSSISGSQEFRIKYAFGQFNLDDWTTHGSWVRFGVQQTPIVDYEEGIYRYRFQGTVFAERVGFLTSSDAGLSGRWVFPSNYGEVHGGFYNGEGYSKAENNNKKAIQIRATVRPLPLGGMWKGLRVTAFLDDDYVVGSAKRYRAIEQVTFEHPMVNLGVDVAQAKDRSSAKASEIAGKGWSLWATPRFGTTGWELLLRHDDFKPNENAAQKQKRNILGLGYWIPNLGRVTTALLLDYDSLQRSGLSPVVPGDNRYGLKMLINF
jgi:hypothetical protein